MPKEKTYLVFWIPDHDEGHTYQRVAASKLQEFMKRLNVHPADCYIVDGEMVPKSQITQIVRKAKKK